LVVEGTRLVDGEITLLTTLGDAEFTAVGELVDGADDFYELIPADISVLLAAGEQAKLVNDVSANYGFRGRDSFGLRTSMDTALLTLLVSVKQHCK
jgi:hypothetical protein